MPIDVEKLAFNTARQLFSRDIDNKLTLERGLSAARAAVQDKIEIPIIRAVERAWSEREQPKRINPANECPKCGGLAFSFWIHSQPFAACESCRVRWRLTGLDFSVAETASQRAQILERVRNYGLLEQRYEVG